METQILDKIKKLHQHGLKGEVKTLDTHEVNPGLDKSSRENYLYFFLPCALNFQRSSPGLWKSALNTWEDRNTNYLFFPELVVKTDFDKIKLDLAKHKLAIQTNKHPKIWHDISSTLNKYYENDPRKLMEECNYEIKSLIQTLQIDKKSLFPYLGGIKLSNYVLAIMSWFTDVKFKDFYNLSIIPDTHIIKSTIKLGILDENCNPADVEKVWRDILKDLKISPTEMHSILWNWSRNNFSPELD